MDLGKVEISKTEQLAKRNQTMTVRIDKSGLISLSSHNGFLSYRKTESWESRQSLPQILSWSHSHSLVSFFYKCMKCDLKTPCGDWRLDAGVEFSLWDLSMIKEASISAPVTSSLFPMHPCLLSLPCSFSTHFFFGFLSLWLQDIWQKLQSFMKFKSWWGSNRKPESPSACLKDLTAGRQLDKKQPLKPALQSDFQW